MGHAGGYHSEISHRALWYCSDQMSRGWHKQNEQDWSLFTPDSSCLSPAHAPVPPWIILFLLFCACSLSRSLHICLSSAVFLIFLTEGGLHASISSSSSYLYLHVSLYSCLLPLPSVWLASLTHQKTFWWIEINNKKVSSCLSSVIEGNVMLYQYFKVDGAIKQI